MVALQGDTGIASDAWKVDDLATLAAAEVNVSGRLEADDGATLIDLIGLDRPVVADKRPGWLRIAAKGPLDGALAVDGQLSAELSRLRRTVRSTSPSRPARPPHWRSR